MKKTLIKKAQGKQYDVNGALYLLENGHYYIEVTLPEKTYGRELPYIRDRLDKRYIEDLENDISWMALEDLYEDILLEIVE